MYNDAVEHNEVMIMEACSKVIVECFEEICEQDALNEILELNIDNLISILKSDKLNLVNEEYLIEIVRKYIAVRDAIPTKEPESA